MKKTSLFILLFLSNIAFSQKKFKLDPNSFIIGMFNDYNGRQIALDHPKESMQLTHFYCSEKKLKQLFLDSIQKFYNVNDINVTNGFVYSKSLFQHFNSYYKIKKLKDYGFIYDDIDYTAYSLKLKRHKFSSKNKKMSFIIGSFYLHGNVENNIFQIRMANSVSHYKTILHFLKNVGFKYKASKICYDCMPAVQTITFTPTPEYLSYFLKTDIPKANYDDCDKNGL